MKKSQFLALLFSAVIFSLSAQDNSVNTKRFIEVSGTSETMVTPDELFVTIKLLERVEKQEKITIEKQEAELKKHLKELGIDISALTLNSAEADYSKIRTFKKDVLISKSYVLKIKNAELLAKVYERLDAMNAHDAYISKYTHSNIANIQKDNRIKAVKIAQEKAEYLLTALNQQVGPPLYVSEIENYVEDGQGFAKRSSMLNVMRMDANQLNEESEEISFKKIKVRSSFQIKFEILNK